MGLVSKAWWEILSDQEWVVSYSFRSRQAMATIQRSGNGWLPY